MNLIDKMFPKAYKVRKNYYRDGEETFLGSYDFTIVDNELDPFDVHINAEGVEINTEKYTHISLDKDNLFYLLDKLMEYENDTSEFFDEEQDG